MTDYVIPPPATPSVAIAGSSARFPIRRVFCVGRNYAAHAREMGKDPKREPPFFFMKPADAVVAAEGTVPYPTGTHDLHHEIERVVALAEGGSDISPIQPSIRTLTSTETPMKIQDAPFKTTKHDAWCVVRPPLTMLPDETAAALTEQQLEAVGYFDLPEIKAR